MSFRIKIIAIVWVTVAVMLRVHGSVGADASIVSGLLFLIWTAPFGFIWQFCIYNYVLILMPKAIAQIFGDITVIIIGFLFWFIFIPKIWNRKN